MSGRAASMKTAAQPQRSGLRWAVWIALALGLAVFPEFGSVYVVYMACLIGINVIATVGLNLTVGYAGLLSIGHSAFLGVGAYVSGLMWLHLGTPLPVNILGGALAAFLVGIAFGVPALRIKGVYLAIGTLAAQYSLYFIFQQWTSVTGGDRGLSLPKLDVLGMGEKGFYYVVAALTVALLVAAKNLFRTRVGRSFIAVRERDYAAEVLGINVVQTKLLAFGVGAAYAGVAGALGAAFLRIVTPDQFTLLVSVFFLAAVVVGGRASILGSILGAVFMTLMPEILQFVLGVVSGGANLAVVIVPLREIIFGALIVGFLLFEPRGLVGLIERALGRAETFDSTQKHDH